MERSGESDESMGMCDGLRRRAQTKENAAHTDGLLIW